MDLEQKVLDLEKRVIVLEMLFQRQSGLRKLPTAEITGKALMICKVIMVCYSALKVFIIVAGAYIMAKLIISGLV